MNKIIWISKYEKFIWKTEQKEHVPSKILMHM